MKEIPIISISGLGINQQEIAQNRQLLHTVTYEQDVPWWEDGHTTPSKKYYIYVIDPADLGKSKAEWEGKQRFTFAKHWSTGSGTKAMLMDNGTIEKEEINHTMFPPQRQIWVKGNKLGSFIFSVPVI